jgi:hypothetical protein
MLKRNLIKGLKRITAIACIVLLIACAQCESEVISYTKIGVSGGKEGVFKPDDEIIVDYEVQLPTNYELYEVSISNVLDSNNIVKKWDGKFKNGAIKQSMPLTGLKPGNYRVTLAASSGIGDNPVIIHAIFHVVNKTFLRIIKYIDANGNGKRDLNENGIGDGTFKYGLLGEVPTEGKTLDDGSIVLLDPVVGEYKIEEIPQDGWYPTDAETKTIDVSYEKDNLVEFGGIQAGYINIESFADLNGNDIKEENEYPATDRRFEVTGEEFSQTFKTDGNRINIALKPGVYLITEVQKDCWAPTGETSKSVTVMPTETAFASFGNKPLGSITMIIFQDINKNGKYDPHESIPGMNFSVSVQNRTEQFKSGNDGTAKYVGIPEVFSISASAPEIWILKGEANKTEKIDFCEDKQLIFEVVPREIKIENLIPEDNAILSSPNMSFSWSTSEISSGNLYIKTENKSNYTLVRGGSGIDHFINGTNLIRNTKYNYFVRSEKDIRFTESQIRSFTINNGVIFEPRDYNIEIIVFNITNLTYHTGI